MKITNLNNAAELANALSIGSAASDAATRAKPVLRPTYAETNEKTQADVVQLSETSRAQAAKRAEAAKADIAAKNTASTIAAKQAALTAHDAAPSAASPANAQDVQTATAPAAQDKPAPPATSASPDSTQPDLNGLLAAYGSSTGEARFDARFDYNNDGRIDFNDLNSALSSLAATPPQPETPQTFSLSDVTNLLSSYGRRQGEQGFDARFDTNQDGVVDFTDLNHVLSNLASPISTNHQQQLAGLIEGYGTGVGDPLFNSAFDYDNDGRISFTDLNELLSRIGGQQG